MKLDRAVLVLNASFEPISIVSAQRAIVLTFLDRADVIKTSGDVAHAQRPQDAMEIPSVIRLRTYVKVPHTRRVPVTRRNVLARDGHVCSYCDAIATTIDHIVPRAHGGEHRWKNVASACKSCNGTKRDRTPEEAHMPLLIVPYEPQGNGALVVLHGKDVDPLWAEFLTPRELVPAG